MSERADDVEDELIDDQDQDLPDNQDDAAEGDDADDDAGDTDDNPDEDADDDLVISFDGAEPGEDAKVAPDLVNRLRQANRDQAKELAAYRRGDIKPVEKVELGPKPTLESCGYDEDAFETALVAYKDTEAKIASAAADAAKAGEAQRAAYQADQADYYRQRGELKARDFEVAETAVSTGLNEWQEIVLIKAATDKAKVVYALGKHPAKLAELAKIDDPIKLAVAITKLEGQLKVTTRKKGVEPDEQVKGSAPLSRGVDKKLERLEAAAARTGDRTEVVRYRRELKQAAAKK